MITFFSLGMPERASASGGLSALQHSSGGRNGTSFHGCLRNLYINGKLQDLGASLGPGVSGSGTAQSTTRQWLGQGVEPGCQPCQRGVCDQGDCHSTGHRGFTCTCHPGWTGTLCDQQVNNPCDGNKWVLFCVSLSFYERRCLTFLSFSLHLQVHPWYLSSNQLLLLLVSLPAWVRWCALWWAGPGCSSSLQFVSLQTWQMQSVGSGQSLLRVQQWLYRRGVRQRWEFMFHVSLC